jgi:chromosomal replication initiation ATPase DnaA
MSPETIIAEVAQITGVPVAAITGRRRTRRVCYARFLAVHAIHQAGQWLSLCEIAEALRRRDHGTISHALARHLQLLSTEPLYQRWHTALAQSLATVS